MLTKAKRKNKILYRVVLLLTGSLLMHGLVGCGTVGGREIVLSTGFYENEIFRLEGDSCNQGEIKVYLANIMNQYSNVYGEEIWQTDRTEGKLASELKETVLARVVKIKIMNLMAAQYGLSLSEMEKQTAAEAGKEYYNSLSPEELQAFGDITEEEITTMYEEYALAGRLYSYITKEINTEISDDEARSVLVEQIVIYKDSVSENSLETGTASEASIRMATFAQKAREEEADFAKLASLYNEAGEDKISVLRGQMPKKLEDIIFNLEKDQVSEIVETQEAYYLFHCISPVDYSRIDSAKQEIVKLRKQTLFDETYEGFSKNISVYLNEESWKALEPTFGGKVDTADFFDIYSRYFPE